MYFIKKLKIFQKFISMGIFSFSSVYLIIFLFLVSFKCTKPVYESADKAEMPATTSSPNSTAFESRKADTDQINQEILPAGNYSKQRLLIYEISLSYKVDKMNEARSEIIKLISSNGFLLSSNYNHELPENIMYFSFKIKSANIYEFLAMADKVGVLKSENIRATDLTESSVRTEQKIKRENIRILRRQNALTGNAGAVNWQKREDSLSASEDRSDEALMAKWKISDDFEWATVNLTLQGPQIPVAIEIPVFKNALINSLNLLFQLVYGLILLLPLLIPVFFVFIKRKKIISWIKSKKNN